MPDERMPAHPLRLEDIQEELRQLVVIERGSLDLRLAANEQALSAHAQRVQTLEDEARTSRERHRSYIDSVTALRTHFDGELLALRQTALQIGPLGEKLEQVSVLIAEVNRVLRVENGSGSYVSRLRDVERWQLVHMQYHETLQRKREDIWSRLLFEILKVVLTLALGGLLAMIGHQWHLW